MTTYGVTIFGKRRHVMRRYHWTFLAGDRMVWWETKCGAGASVMTRAERKRAAAIPVCKRCEP